MKGWTKEGNSFFQEGPRNKETPQIALREERGRIIAHGIDTRERITVSKEKSVEQIERDIERRLVPKYLAAHEKVVAKRNAVILAEHKRREQVAELAELLGPVGRISPMYPDNIRIYAKGFYGDLRVDCGQVRLELSAPFDVIKKLSIALIGE